ncbi:MAG: hypothetical protein U1E65_26020 [Myxococcota bacterium]
MARVLFVVWLLALSSACGSSPGGNDAEVDAGSGMDAVILYPDARVDAGSGLACGALTCQESELCLAVPTSSCAASATCTAPRESCQDNAISGCTDPRARSCVSLGACLAQPSCACLSGLSICPDGRTPDCLRRGTGITIECSFHPRDAG